MMRSYTVETVEHGVVVRGPIPIEDFSALCQKWAEQGLTEMRPGIASALGATFVVASPDKLEAWEKAAQAEAARKAGGNAELEWLNGTDTGTSSLTIFSVLSESHGAYAFKGRPRPDVPHDPSDFGRCHRLLVKFPAWRERLAEVVAKYPAWAGLVRGWADIERLYLEELPSGQAPRCYALMQSLREEGRAQVPA